MTILGNVAGKLNSFFGIRGDGDSAAEANDVRCLTHSSNGAQMPCHSSRPSAPSPPSTANTMFSKLSHADPHTLPPNPWAASPSPPPQIDGSIDLTSSASPTAIYEDGLLPENTRSRLQRSNEPKQRSVKKHARRHGNTQRPRRKSRS